MEKPSLFIVHTPYHLLLSLTMARPDDTIMVVNDFDRSEHLIKMVRKSYGGSLKAIVSMPGRKDADEILWRRVIISRRNKKYINKYIESGKVSKLFIFNDRAYEGQYAAFQAKKRNIEVIYVEDGLAAYVTANQIKTNHIKTAILKILFGFHHENITILGTSSFVNEVMCFFPEKAIPPLRQKKLLPIDLDAFGHLRGDFVIEATSGIQEDIDCIFVLPHSEILTSNGPRLEDLDASIKSMMQSIISTCEHVAIKYHPRQTTNFLGDYPGLEILPNNIPLELIFLRLRNKGIRYVIGPISTSLYTAKLILGESVEVKLTTRPMVEGSAEFFKSIGVDV